MRHYRAAAIGSLIVALWASAASADINPWVASSVYDPKKWDTSGPETATPWLHPPPGTTEDNWGAFTGDFYDAATMTGSWGGARNRLRLKGVTFTVGYFGQPAGNPVGGVDQGISYRGDLGIGVYFDWERILRWPGAFFTASFSYKHGSPSLTPRYVGNQFPLQLPSFDEDGAARLVHLALGQQLFDNNVEIVAGRIIAGEDFASLRLACTSVNQAICANPIAAAQSISFPTYPNATWGGRIKVKPGKGWYLQGGAYLVYPSFRSSDDHGVQFGAPDGSGALALGEFGLLIGHHRGKDKLPGKYKLGGYYDGEDLQNQFDQAMERGTWGIYAMGEQMLYSEDAVFNEGLSGFVAVSYAPPDLNRMMAMLVIGLSYKGVFQRRSDDAVSLIGAYGRFSNDLADGQRDRGEPVQKAEGLIELNYRIQITPWIFAEPDLQWVINPNGLSSVDDALVIAVAFGLVL